MLEAINNVTAPAQKHATDDAVYTTLLKSVQGLKTALSVVAAAVSRISAQYIFAVKNERIKNKSVYTK